MNSDFNLYEWSGIAAKLKELYPHLTDADLMWRHETKTDFYKVLSAELGVSRREFEKIISNL